MGQDGRRDPPFDGKALFVSAYLLGRIERLHWRLDKADLASVKLHIW
jgi:hypothetical protein